MSWNHEGVKTAHVALLHYIWIERMPKVLSHCGFSLDDAWHTWSMFKENPQNPKIKGIKRAVNEEFMRMVASN